MTHRRDLRLWLPALLWMLVIYLGSSRSALPGPLGESSLLGNVLRAALHLAEYAVLGFLVQRTARQSQSSAASTPAWAGSSLLGSLSRPSVWAWALCLAYACFDEWHQSLVPGRQASLLDILLDAAGAAAGIWLHRRL